MSYFSIDDNIPRLLRDCARTNPDHVYCRSAGEPLTYAALNERVNRLADALSASGVGPGARVAVMLAHHVDHALAFFALAKLGAVNVPINVHLKGAGLEHIIRHSGAEFGIFEDEYGEALKPVVQPIAGFRVFWRGRRPEWAPDAPALAQLMRQGRPVEPGFAAADDDLRAILYTSGTTGPAKGVEMTDRMFRAAALGSIWIGDIAPGSTLHFWDPIYHVFGSEVLVLALMRPVTLAFVPRFSASRFWDEVEAHGATHLHFVGGVLQLLLKQPASPRDRGHTVKVAWGGGAPEEVWRAFEDRFGIPVKEGYGMTETSSFSIINTAGRHGSIGTAVDYFDVEIADDAGRPLAPGQVGEIRVRQKEPNLVTRGYFRNPEKTAEALRGGWLYTGDLGRRDEEGFFYFLGRKKDSLRRRGENVSAWEVENVVNGHPLVEESALIGVVNEFADEDLKLFVKLKPGAGAFDPGEFVQWCSARMAKFQVPRFIAVVEEFSKTPTQRIQKHLLSVSIGDCWDAERPRTPARLEGFAG